MTTDAKVVPLSSGSQKIGKKMFENIRGDFAAMTFLLLSSLALAGAVFKFRSRFEEKE